MLLEDLIARHLAELFGGLQVREHTSSGSRATFDLRFDEEEAEDLLETIQQELRRRERGNAVRLEVSADADATLVTKLVKALDARGPRRLPCRRPAHLDRPDALIACDEFATLRDEPFVPQVVPPFAQDRDIFDVIREQDVLLHHPYESFDSVVEFIERAADDPDVLAIKQTLYRTAGRLAHRQGARARGARTASR